MPFGILKKLFSRRSKDPLPDMRGPLDLGPGDTVVYYQRQFTVLGVLLLLEGPERRHQYHLKDERGELALLSAERDRETVLTLQTLLPPGTPVDLGDASATFEGRTLDRTHQGVAVAWGLGDVPSEKVGEVEYLEYEDDEEMTLLVAESWGQYLEVRSGEYLHEGEITSRRAGEDRFEIRPPPRIDARSLAEERHRQRTAEQKIARIEQLKKDYSQLVREKPGGAAAEAEDNQPASPKLEDPA